MIPHYYPSGALQEWRGMKRQDCSPLIRASPINFRDGQRPCSVRGASDLAAAIHGPIYTETLEQMIEVQ